MLIAKGTVQGQLVESENVETFNIVSKIEVRRIGDSFSICVSDEVNIDNLELDIEKLYEYYVDYSHKKISKYISKVAKRANTEYEILWALWRRWIEAYGVLTPLLCYDKITDVYIMESSIQAEHCEYGLCEVKLFNDDVTYREFVHYLIRRVAERARCPITTYMPMMSVTDRELHARFTISIPPVSEPYIHVRILPRKPWTLSELVMRDALTLEEACTLWYLFDLKVPILVIGPMGSGKTSLANAIAFNSDPATFKAIVADVDEMNLPGHNVLKLFERRSYGLGVRNIDKSELIAHSLRTGVDYVIVNEVRTRSEVSTWIDAVTTGHGGVTTFHASDIESLRIRLENMLGSSKILDEVAVVVMHCENTIREVGSVRTNVKVRRVKYVKVPKHVKIDEQELALRTAALSSMMGLPIRQQLSVLRSFYRSPDKLLVS